tara:strand:- start:740 stop:847 length:108 start_codon:yes stop_codon:yes gene_type:complete
MYLWVNHAINSMAEKVPKNTSIQKNMFIVISVIIN